MRIPHVIGLLLVALPVAPDAAVAEEHGGRPASVLNIGGSGHDSAHAVAVLADGSIVVVGESSSGDLAPDSTAGDADAVIATLTPSGGVRLALLGASGPDMAYDVAVDPRGGFWVCGETWSSGFLPTEGAPGARKGQCDAFLTRVRDGQVIYTALLGGADVDGAASVAVASDGAVWIVGRTSSRDLATTDGSTYGGGPFDGYVARLTPDGRAFDHLSYLGGSLEDRAYGVAVGPGGDAYVTGMTGSRDMESTDGSVQAAFGGWIDIFVTRIDGRTLRHRYSTFLGHTGYEIGFGVAVDARGAAVVTGYTTSHALTITPGCLQPVKTPFDDVFVARFSPDGSRLEYSTYLGGGGMDEATDVLLGPGGEAYVCGSTGSADFPVTAGSPQGAYRGGGAAFQRKGDGFVARIAQDGSAVTYATLLGGSGIDDARGLARGAGGEIVAVGATASSEIAAARDGGARAGPGGGGDMFIARLTPPTSPQERAGSGAPGELEVLRALHTGVALRWRQDLDALATGCGLRAERILIRRSDSIEIAFEDILDVGTDVFPRQGRPQFVDGDVEAGEGFIYEIVVVARDGRGREVRVPSSPVVTGIPKE